MFPNKFTNTAIITKLFIALIIIPLGLATKVYSGVGQQFVVNSLGGIFYVVFFILLASVLWPKAKPFKLSLTILFITCLIEFSQLLENKFILCLRTSFAFRILFGSIFNKSDFLYYLIGALIGLGILFLLKKRTGS